MSMCVSSARAESFRQMNAGKAAGWHPPGNSLRNSGRRGAQKVAQSGGYVRFWRWLVGQKILIPEIPIPEIPIPADWYLQ